MKTLENLKKMIDESNLSISEMARRSGVSRQAIYNIKTGKRKELRISTVENLMKVLKEK